MFSFNNLRLVYKIVVPVGLILIFSLGFLAWSIQSRSSLAVRESAERELAAIAGHYGNTVSNFIEVALSEASAVSHILSTAVEEKAELTRQRVLEMIGALPMHSELIVGCGVLWEPNAFDGNDAAFAGKKPYDDEGRFSIYISSDSNGKLSDPVNVSADEEYYTLPKQYGQPYVTPPYSFEVGGRQMLIVTGCAPITVNGQFKGITAADISLDAFKKIVTDLKVYNSGFGVLLSQEGMVIAHRNESYLNKSIYDLVQLKNPPALQAAMREGKPYMDMRTINGKDMLCYYEPIPFRNTNQFWYLLVNVPMDEILADASRLSTLTIGLCLGALVLVLLIITLVAKSTVRPIIQLAEVAQKVADGKLDTKVKDSQVGGEVGQLTDSLKSMIHSLVQSLSEAEAMKKDAEQQATNAQEATTKAEAAGHEAQIKSEAILKAADKLEEVAGVVSSASAELSAQIEQSEHGATEQVSRVTETATAMNEMNSTVAEVARNAGRASDISLQTRQQAAEGAKIVNHAVTSIQQVQKESLALKEDMIALDGHTQAISRIMNVISDIADQTNLLALNAAIEAARAGEAGRGFAVVADEVRKLAEKTMASTTDVSNAIKAIQNSTRKSMEQVDHAVQAIEEATELANRSGAALNRIVDMAESTADQVRAIATASEQQSSSSEAINHSITQVNTIAGETARAMEEAARAVSDLAGQAQSLGGLIKDMKRS